MSKRRLRGVLLCEDVEHERFFRRLLERKWFGKGKLRVVRIPDRQGAGDAYVLQRYAQEVKVARQFQARGENYALIVAVDGDQPKLQGRLRQLEQKLEEAGLVRRGEREAIVICVPTRNVETWELWLCGDRSVDENGDFKRRFRDAERRGEASAKLAVEGWFRELSPEDRKLEETKLPALTVGRMEIDRLS